MHEIRAALTRFTNNPEMLVRKMPQTQKAPKMTDKAIPNIPVRNSTWKENFESHPVVFGFALIALGFGVGFTTRSYLPSEIITKPSSAPVSCRVEGADRIEEAHQLRMEPLQKQLIEFEASASNRMFIQPDQDKYKEAAVRIRQDITMENASYQAAIQQLSKKCQ